MRARSAFSPALLLLVTSTALAAPPRFAAPFLSYASGFDARSVAIADVNGDGRADVLISNMTGLEVRLGAGDGTLGTATTIPAARSEILVAGDLDGDGHADVVMAADSLHVSARRGNGDGTFQAPVNFVVAKGPVSAALVDLNGDGDLDFVCVAEKAQAVSILLGDGTGGFGPRTDVQLGGLPVPLRRATSTTTVTWTWSLRTAACPGSSACWAMVRETLRWRGRRRWSGNRGRSRSPTSMATRGSTPWWGCSTDRSSS